MTDSAPRHASPGADRPITPMSSSGHDHAAGSNPEVQFERSDVTARGVITFVVALGLVVIVSGAFLTGLFRHYEERAAKANAAKYLPLAVTGRERLPVQPRLEGIDPNEDVDRAWPRAAQPAAPPPWFGYNVRVVPAEGRRSPGADAEERDRIAALAMAKTLQNVNATLIDLAGTLPSRPGATPPDGRRRSGGAANSGRSAGEKTP
jgi:hypothetical protein